MKMPALLQRSRAECMHGLLNLTENDVSPICETKQGEREVDVLVFEDGLARLLHDSSKRMT